MVQDGFINVFRKYLNRLSEEKVRKDNTNKRLGGTVSKITTKTVFLCDYKPNAVLKYFSSVYLNDYPFFFVSTK